MSSSMQIFLWLGLSTGCGLSVGDPEATDTGAGGWWEVDEEKDDRDEDDDEESEGWLALDWVLDPNTGTGTFEGHFGACEISGAVTDAVETDPCEDCGLAMSMTYTSVALTGEDCEDLDDLEGSTDSFGHGLEKIFEIDGLSIHALYEFDEADGWAEAWGGYSVLKEGTWYFGVEI